MNHRVICVAVAVLLTIGLIGSFDAVSGSARIGIIGLIVVMAIIGFMPRRRL